jgi:hypothetical protein
MKLIARMVRFLFWAVFLWWAVWLIGQVMAWVLGVKPRQEPESRARTVPGEPRSQRLYRDPWCGTHVSEEISLAVPQGGQTLHFCSAECRDQYFGSQRCAANG